MHYTLTLCFYILTFLSCLLVAVRSNEVKGKCLPGSKHKAEPSPEDNTYKACHVFKNSSCCTSEFTNQLAVPVVTKIGNFSWTLCGNLSKRCQEYMIGVECFYSCSPYVGLWANPKFPSAFINAPVCSDYCDEWYEACKDDMTCAENWIEDFDQDSYGTNKCKQNCTTFGAYYANGTQLCENMWGPSFKYTEDEDNCLHFRYNMSHNPNKDLVQKIFGHKPDGGSNTSLPNSVSTTSNPDGDGGYIAVQGSVLGVVLAAVFHIFFILIGFGH